MYASLLKRLGARAFSSGRYAKSPFLYGIKWFIDKLPNKIKINNDLINQFKIPSDKCENVINKNNNHIFPKMDLQIYLKRRNISIWAGYDNCNQVEVYYSFII